MIVILWLVESIAEEVVEVLVEPKSVLKKEVREVTPVRIFLELSDGQAM